MSRSCPLALVLTLLLNNTPARAADDPKPAKPQTVEQLTESARKSVVVIVFAGRDGKQQGLGTGFVLSKDGLIATNLHVIGEARPITVQLPDGTRHEVTAVHASDRSLDLAVVKVNAKDLTPLELGDSDALKTGQAVVALGHPRGLKYSVVSGVISGRRDVDGMNMIQLAIPIEQGNSGGPVLDLHGRVVGVVTMKSLVTANLGFAVPVKKLRPLLERPNPIAMDRWLTIGALDQSEWKTLAGGRWRQRAGRIIADGAGGGFGGRTLCLSQQPVPKTLPYEAAVTVKLGDESGAAGLVFHADGGDKHYGFYPSNGKMRFVRFEGPDVFSWKILHDEPNEHYKAGEWNTLKVRIEKDKFLCYLNEQLVLESDDRGLEAGRVGFAAFRGTPAEFKHFQLADRIVSQQVPDEVIARVRKLLDGLPATKSLPPKLIDKLAPNHAAGIALLRERARLLEEQAAELKKLALAVHQQRVMHELAQALDPARKNVDLLHAALLVAKLDNEELDVDIYRKEVDRLARQIQAALPKKADDQARLAALNKFLFQERGFHGSRVDYYTRANSYLNEVIDDREGLPITLSVLYMELAQRIGLTVVGVPLPGHFVVRHENGDKGQLIDVYDGGKALTEEDAGKIVERITGKPLDPESLNPIGKKGIILRMLHNLVNVAQREQDLDGMFAYLDTIVTVDPQAHEERWVRAVLRWKAGRPEAALPDLEWFLEHNPPGVDLERVRELHRLLTRPKR